jgi:hypothetical protein
VACSGDRFRAVGNPEIIQFIVDGMSNERSSQEYRTSLEREAAAHFAGASPRRNISPLVQCRCEVGIRSRRLAAAGASSKAALSLWRIDQPRGCKASHNLSSLENGWVSRPRFTLCAAFQV